MSKSMTAHFGKMAAQERCSDDAPTLDLALRSTCLFFEIEALMPDQIKAVKAFLSGKNIYFSAPTGYGKSLIFQCLTLIRDVMRDEIIGTTKALVISPLKSLMMDQVAKIKQTGVTGEAIYAGQSREVLESIKSGDYSVIYASPESILGTDYWQNVLSSEHFQTNCKIIVIDEAHCVVHW